jgi:hypothetical protein
MNVYERLLVFNERFNTVSTRNSIDGTYDSYANHTHTYTTPSGGGSATVTPISILPRHYSVIYIIKL